MSKYVLLSVSKVGAYFLLTHSVSIYLTTEHDRVPGRALLARLRTLHRLRRLGRFLRLTAGEHLLAVFADFLGLELGSGHAAVLLFRLFFRLLLNDGLRLI